MQITLKTLSQATGQQVFDQVVAHAVGQKVACKNIGGDCMYRNVKGQACFAGALISDEEYNVEMEGYMWGESPVPMAHIRLIRDLQLTHDTFAPRQWSLQLKKVAQKFILTFDQEKFECDLLN